MLAARAFTNEPFMVHLAGDEPVDRLSAALHHDRAMPWTEDVQLGALVDDVLIGVCLCSLVDRCLICTRDDLDGAAPDDDERRLDWEFARNARRVHATLGDHAWLSLVAVDPVVQGGGVGRALVVAVIAALRQHATPAVLLECEPERADFYGRSGFQSAGSFWDPSSGSEALVMEARLG